VIGDKTFLDSLTGQNQEQDNPEKNQDNITRIEEIIRKISGYHDYDIYNDKYNNICGKTLACILKNHTDMKISDIGKLFGKNLKSISRYIVRFEEEMKERPDYRIFYNQVLDHYEK